MLPFDVEACHHIIPKILPWNFPSELSQLIEKEVAKSIATMDENSYLQVLVNQELDINEKKDKVKRIKRSLADCNGFESQQSAISEFSNCSGSPVTSSSDVHEEVYKRHSLESNSDYLFKFQMNQAYLSSSFSKPVSSILERETTYDACLNETYKSFYASSLHGSISVPEAAIQSGIKPMTGPVSGSVEGSSLDNELTPTTFTFCQSSDKLPPNSYPFANPEILESSFTKAVVQNFRDGNTKTTTVSNAIDACSHIDSTSNTKSFDSSPSIPMDMVQELWRELRTCRKDLG